MQATLNNKIIHYERSSSFTKLARTVAWVLFRFLKNIRNHNKDLSRDLDAEVMENGKSTVHPQW